MTEELAQALGPLSARAEAIGTSPLDRISVRDHVREVEIGAFQSERGVTQRVQFNVVLEVARHLAGREDDVDMVVSYDSIVGAIDAALAEERLKLLETLAERIAAGCLSDPRVVRVFLRVEKLDRIPGALGVEIVRSQKPEADTVVRPIVVPTQAPDQRQDHDAKASQVAPRIVCLGVSKDEDDLTTAWIAACRSSVEPVILVPVPEQDPTLPGDPEAARRIGLLALDQAAWALAADRAHVVVAESRTEIEWAIASGLLPVWSPSALILAAADAPESSFSVTDGLARWLGDRIGARDVIVVADLPDASGTPDREDDVLFADRRSGLLRLPPVAPDR